MQADKIHIKEIELDSIDIRDFVRFPRKLYRKNEYMQDEAETEAILKRTHPLSHYFTVYGFLAKDEKGIVLGRALLTLYSEDATGYLGFYESIDDVEVCKCLVEQAEEKARIAGCEKLIGPVNASFWLGYRFKCNLFGNPYTGEPYNKEYYPKLWRAVGFEIEEAYCSNHYRVITKQDRVERFEKRLRDRQEAGYVFRQPSDGTFEQTLEQVYDLLIVLYRYFPAYKFITKEEFCRQYGYLKRILNYDMVTMVYYQEKPVGFLVSIPNYGNKVYGKLTIPRILRILTIRRKPKEYVMLYMGVDGAHRGLGIAMAEYIKEELRNLGTPSVGALIRKGNYTEYYFREQIDFSYEYVLMKKKV